MSVKKGKGKESKATSSAKLAKESGNKEMSTEIEKLETLRTYIRKEIELYEENKLTEAGKIVLRIYKEMEDMVR